MSPALGVTVVGHITKDIVCVPGREGHVIPGGSALYISAALRSLGVDVSVLTKFSPRDEPLFRDLLEMGIEVENLGSSETTVFENTYTSGGLGDRRQRVLGIAEPFSPEDMHRVRDHFVILGPLTRDEIPTSCFDALRDRSISLDAQGYLREVRDQRVVLTENPELVRLLEHVDVLKVDDSEGKILSGQEDIATALDILSRRGPKETLMTFASGGSVVRHAFASERVPALQVSEVVDATGCGDTYLAGYVAERLRGASPRDAGWFAATAAGLKLSVSGPLRMTRREVLANEKVFERRFLRSVPEALHRGDRAFRPGGCAPHPELETPERL